MVVLLSLLAIYKYRQLAAIGFDTTLAQWPSHLLTISLIIRNYAARQRTPKITNEKSSGRDGRFHRPSLPLDFSYHFKGNLWRPELLRFFSYALLGCGWAGLAAER